VPSSQRHCNRNGLFPAHQLNWDDVWRNYDDED